MLLVFSFKGLYFDMENRALAKVLRILWTANEKAQRKQWFYVNQLEYLCDVFRMWNTCIFLFLIAFNFIGKYIIEHNLKFQWKRKFREIFRRSIECTYAGRCVIWPYSQLILTKQWRSLYVLWVLRFGSPQLLFHCVTHRIVCLTWVCVCVCVCDNK